MKTPRVLVIDENAEVARLENAMFRLHNFNVDVTVDANEALRRLSTRHYDAHVVGAPLQISGQYLLDVLVKQFPALLPCTIVVTSKVRDTTVLERCRRSGVYAVLAKPFDVDELSRLVVECIANDCRPAATQWIGIPEASVPKTDSAR